MPIRRYFRASLHGHSQYSDGRNTVYELVKTAHQQQLSYLALTDHDSIDGIYELYQACKYLNNKSHHQLTPIAGVELMTNACEVILLKPASINHIEDFLKWADKLCHRSTPPSLIPTVTKAIRDHNAIVYFPHPLFNWLGMHSIEEKMMKQLYLALDERSRRNVGLEINNWACNMFPTYNKNREQHVDMYAHQFKFARFAGSDYHTTSLISAQTTIIPGFQPNYTTFIQAVRQRQIYPGPSRPLNLKTMSQLYISLAHAFFRSKMQGSNQ